MTRITGQRMRRLNKTIEPKAARIVAAEQTLPGPTETIEYQDEEGRWHEERASGDDRPETEVQA